MQLLFQKWLPGCSESHTLSSFHNNFPILTLNFWLFPFIFWQLLSHIRQLWTRTKLMDDFFFFFQFNGDSELLQLLMCKEPQTGSCFSLSPRPDHRGFIQVTNKGPPAESSSGWAGGALSRPPRLKDETMIPLWFVGANLSACRFPPISSEIRAEDSVFTAC